MTDTLPVAIIGAGIAGLSCARRLQDAGLPVELLEAAPIPGGRVATRHGQHWQCDHGAQYFTAREQAFIDTVRSWQAQGAAAIWQPHLVALDEQGMQEAGGGEIRYVGTPSMSALAGHMARKLPIRTNTRVRALGREGTSWLLDTESEGVLARRYAAVVLTLPAPQTFELLVVTAPPFAEVARTANMRGCWALMAHYEQEPALPFDAAFVNHGLLSWVAREASKPGRPDSHTWLLHASAAEWTADNLNTPTEDVAHAMIEAFVELGAPVPAAWTLYRWLYAHNTAACDIGPLWNPATRIGVAGDWLQGGRVEGAWLSGHRLAGLMLDQFGGHVTDPGRSTH